MAAPKRRTSKMKQRTRLAAQAWRAPQLRVDKESGELVASHTLNPKTGVYVTQSGAEVVYKAKKD